MNEFGEKGALNIIDLLPNSTVFDGFSSLNIFSCFHLDINCIASSTKLYHCNWSKTVGICIKNKYS